MKTLALVALASLPAATAGCAIDNRIDVSFTGASPVVVDESSQPGEYVPQRVHGVTRRGQVVRLDCSVTVLYDANDLAGPGVFVQARALHLHTRRLPRGVEYDLDCSGALIVQLPRDATAIQATLTGGTGPPAPLSVRAPVASVRISSGRRLQAQRGTQLAVLAWPPALAGGDYRVRLTFGLSEARPIREKVLYAASVRCGRSRYLQPVLPPVTRMARVPGFTITPSPQPIRLAIPRIAGASESGRPAEATRRLSCAR